MPRRCPVARAPCIKRVLPTLQERRAELGAFDRVRGLLQAASEELHDCPLYLDLHSVCASLKCTPMKHDVFRSGLLNAGAHC